MNQRTDAPLPHDAYNSWSLDGFVIVELVTCLGEENQNGWLAFKAGHSLFFRIAQLDTFSIHAVQQIEPAGIERLFDHSLRSGDLHLSLHGVELLASQNQDPNAAAADIVHIGQVDHDLFRPGVHNLFHLLIPLFGRSGGKAALHLDEDDPGVLARGDRQRVSGSLIPILRSFPLGILQRCPRVSQIPQHTSLTSSPILLRNTCHFGACATAPIMASESPFSVASITDTLPLVDNMPEALNRDLSGKPGKKWQKVPREDEEFTERLGK